MSPVFRNRRIAFAGLVILIYVAVEAAAFLGIVIVTRQVFTFSRLNQERTRQVEVASAIRPGSAGAAQATTVIAPHPFLGFTYDPRYDPAGMKALHTVPVSDWGFLDDKSPIQTRSAGQVVVGVFGGSMAFWLSIHGLDALAEELTKVSDFRGKRLVLVRTALGGSSNRSS